MNPNPIIIQPGQNPNSGNIPCYSFNITLYPCQDPPIVSPGINNSGFQQGNKTSFSNSYYPKEWGSTGTRPQVPLISQNGKTVTIPVPIPNSIYQCFQNFPTENISTYGNGYAVQKQLLNGQRDYYNKDTFNRSNFVPNFASINPHSYLNQRREFMKSKIIIPTRTNSRIPPLPPPPPPQYFTLDRNNREDFGRYSNYNPVNEETERNFRQVNKTLIEDLKGVNWKRYNILSKSNSCPPNNLTIPPGNWNPNATRYKVEERILPQDRSNNLPFQTTGNWNPNSIRYKAEERIHPQDRYGNKDEKFMGGGDSPESYSPDNSEEKFACECTTCRDRDRFEEQKTKANWQSSHDILNEDSSSKSLPHVATTVLLEQMNTFREKEEKAQRKLIDKATCPMQSTTVDYDSSPVWEFERRDSTRFHRILSPSRTRNATIQCDLDLELPTGSTEILWCRTAKHSSPTISYTLSERSCTYRKHSDEDDVQQGYLDFRPDSPKRLPTSINKTSDNHIDHDIRNGMTSDCDEQGCAREWENLDENSNRTAFLEKQNECSPSTSTSSIVYETRRPTFEEVMEYLEKADEQEKLELGLQHKSSIIVKNPISIKDPYSQVKRDENEMNIYGSKFEERYKKVYNKVNPPIKPTIVKRAKNYNQYNDSYTEVVTRRPPVEMFPVSPGPLDFPKNALGKLLIFLDSNCWQEVLDGFRFVVRLARHHREVLCPDLRYVILKSEKHLGSLKSAVSRAALACFTELVLNVGKAMEPYIEKILNKILLKSMDCNKFLRWECRNVLNAIVHAFPIGKSLICIESGFRHKSAMVRATISIMLKKWVRKVGPQKAMIGYAERILPMIITLIQERGWEARAGAKDALNELISHPNFMGVLRTVVPYEDLVEASRRVKAIRELMEQDCLNFRI